jgi:peptide chain release factor 1
MEKKVERLLARFSELEEALANPECYENPKLYKELTQEHSYLSEVKDVWVALQKARSSLKENKSFLKEEKDAEMQNLLKEDIVLLEKEISLLENKLETLLVPPNPDDHRNIIVELRAGTGGDEAALFVGDCIRMYQLYAARQGWKCELLSCTPSEIGGFREYIMVMSGSNVKRFMQYEAGTHRVQRVPDTEAQGRVHTSAITVAVLAEPSPEEEVKVDEKDLKIDTYRSSGAGGQHVNTTDSAVRITHLPSGIVVYCQEERSQHKNKEKALRLLKARLVEVERKKRNEEEASARAAQVGSGDRSERIRTYNFPQNRITDHRINLTLYNLDQVMEGALEPISNGLVAFFYQKQLSS